MSSDNNSSFTEAGRSQETVRSPEGLKLLVTVVNRIKSEYYADLIQARLPGQEHRQAPRTDRRGVLQERPPRRRGHAQRRENDHRDDGKGAGSGGELTFRG